MAVKVKEQVSIVLMNEFRKKFPTALVQKATQEAAQETIKIIRDRTNSGIDLYGKRFAPYTRNYERFKARFMKGKTKVKRKTSWAARKASDNMRLTGELFTAMSTVPTQYAQFSEKKINSSFSIFIRGKQAEKAQWLANTRGANKYTSYSKKAREFFGLCKNDTIRAKEEARIFARFCKVLGVKFSGDITVK